MEVFSMLISLEILHFTKAVLDLEISNVHKIFAALVCTLYI